MSESVNNTTEDPEIAALKIAISASFSLAVMIADFVWLIRHEVKIIWRGLGSWHARIYLLLRYAGLASQIFNVYFTVRMYTGIGTTQAGCQLWFAYQAIVVQILLASVEGALMHRIYALFLGNRYILMVLVALAAGQIASMVMSAYLVVPSSQHTVTCMIVGNNPGNSYFGVTTMTTNILIFFMTSWRFIFLPLKLTQHGIGQVVMRDTSLSVLGISGLMLFLTLCSLEVIQPSIGGNITYYWLVCILWMSIGRIILNQETLAREIRRDGVQFTTQIEAWDEHP
ncbi:hypothetical protein HD554DRAFT_1618489 [Boletus coccyginus]|nr:hypothetical protein HD554DRAFT_1618489 [Boletus coccyginus]